MSIYPKDVIEKILDQLEPRKVLKLINYRADTIQEMEGVIRCFCPIHQESVFRTLTVDPADKSYRCSYSLCQGNQGGDLIDLFARGRGVEYDEGAMLLTQELELDVELPPTAEFLEKTLEVSLNYIELGVLDEAERGLQKVVSIQPDNIQAWEGLLTCYEAMGNEDRMVEVMRHMAQAMIDRGQFEQAHGYCEKILERIPEDELVLRQLARCQVGMGDYTQALDSYMRLADQLESQEEFERAIEVYHEVERLDLDIIDVYPHIINAMLASDRAEDAVNETIQKADDFIQSQDWDRALDCLRYVLDMDVQRDDVRRRFIEVGVRAGMTEERLEDALDIVEQLVERARINDAAEMLDLLRQVQPDHPRLMELATSVYHAKGDTGAALKSQLALADQLFQCNAETQARSILEQLREDNPEAIPVLSRLANLYRQRDERSKAISAFQQILRLLERDQNLDEAAPVALTIAELDPENIEAQLNFARLALAAEMTDQAVDRLWALLRNLIERKDSAHALELIERYGAVMPNQGEMLFLKHHALKSLGQPEAAREALFEACQAHERAGEFGKAIALLKAHVADRPDDTGALDRLASLGEQAKLEKARSTAIRRKLLREIEEGNAGEVLNLLPSFLQATDQDMEAVEKVLKQLIGRKMPEAVAVVCDCLIDQYMERGATSRALGVASTRLSHGPDDEKALEHLLQIARGAQRVGPMAGGLLDWARRREEAGEGEAAAERFDKLRREFPEDNDLLGRYIRFLTESPGIPEAEERARRLMAEWARSRSTDEAERLCREQLERDPEDLIWSELLLILLRETRQEAAYQQQAVSLARGLARERQWARAVDLLNELLERNPDHADARQQLVAALRAMKRLPEAVAQSLELARQWRRRRAHDRAIKTLQDAAEIAPNDTGVLEELAACHEESGNDEGAVDNRARAAELHEKQGDIEQAVRHLRMALRAAPEREDIRQRLEALENRNKSLQDAVHGFENEADLSLTGGDLEHAISARLEAVKLKPDDLDLRRRLARLYLEADQPDEAHSQLEQAALRLFERQSYREATELVEEVLAADPGRVRARRIRAEALARQGEDRKALEEFLKISGYLDSHFDAPRALRADANETDHSLRLVEEYSFDHFVVGSPNSFAHATAMAVARAPASQYNPLFLYSDVGLGKTHLVNAIANFIAATRPDMKIVYVSADDFASSLVEAISNNAVRAFRNRFRSASVLLIDDIQFLAGKERAQEEFFNIFNNLFQAKKQIVITGDRPPKELSLLERRLRSRFGAGVVVDIQPPDHETREAILLRERADLGLEDHVSQEVIREIAERVDTNVRELKAAFKQVLAIAQVRGQPPTLEDARQVLDQLLEKVG